MQSKTYTQLLEVVTCMMTYTARAFNFKDNPNEIVSYTKGMKELAEELKLLGTKTINPRMWQEYCANIQGNTPITIPSSELPAEMWQEFKEVMTCIVPTVAVMEDNSNNPEMVAYILAHQVKPLLEKCRSLLSNEHGEIRGKSFIEKLKAFVFGQRMVKYRHH